MIQKNPLIGRKHEIMTRMVLNIQKYIYNLDRNEQTMAVVSEEGELLNSASFFLKLHTHFKIRITQKIHVFISL